MGAALAVVMGLSLARPAAAEPMAWHAEKATALSAEIVGQLRAMLAAADEVPKQPTVLQQRRRDAAAFQVRRTLDAAEELQRKLQADWDGDVTVDYFDLVRGEGLRVRELFGDAVAFERTLSHWEAARKAARELARYYDGAR